MEQKGPSISLETVKVQSAEDQKEILKIEVEDENTFFFPFFQEEDKKGEDISQKSS